MSGFWTRQVRKTKGLCSPWWNDPSISPAQKRSPGRSARGMFGFPRTCLALKGSTGTTWRRYICQQAGTKSSSRSADKLGTTADQPVFVFRLRYTQDFLCSCFRGYVWDNCFRCHWGRKICLCPGRTDPLASSPTRSRPTPPPCFGPIRNALPMVRLCFVFDRKDLTGRLFLARSRCIHFSNVNSFLLVVLSAAMNAKRFVLRRK